MMFSIIHKEMKNVTGFLVGVTLLSWLLDKLGVEANPVRPDTQAIMLVLMWLALVAYRSVEKLSALEKPQKP